MKNIIFILLFVSISVFGQKSNENSNSSIFRLDLNILQFAMGTWNKSIKNYENHPNDYILTKDRKYSIQTSFDIQAIFLDKIGLEAGFDLLKSEINEDLIRKEFQNFKSNDLIYLPEVNPISGSTPFQSEYRLRLFKFGLLGNIKWNNFAILPYIDYLTQINAFSPSLKVKITPNNLTTFTRQYSSNILESKGMKTGFKIRYYFKRKNFKYRINTKFYMQFYTDFTFLDTKMANYYFDNNNSDLKQDYQTFHTNTFVCSFGLTFLALDFSVKKK